MREAGARACVLALRRPEEPGSRVAAAGRQTARNGGESAGRGMGPPESAAQAAAEAVELQVPEQLLMERAAPSAGEEPADAPGRGRCWMCGASACGSRAEPGECAGGTLRGSSWAGWDGVVGLPCCSRGASPECRHLPRGSLESERAVTPPGGGLQSACPPRPRRSRDPRKFLSVCNPLGVRDCSLA